MRYCADRRRRGCRAATRRGLPWTNRVTAALEAKVAELSARLEALTGGQESTASDAPEAAPADHTRSRRGLLKLAGAAAVGTAVGVVAAASPAYAAHQDEDLGVGLVNPTAGTANLKTTLNLLSPTAGGSALLVQTGNAFANGDASFPAAVSAWATINSHPTGLYAFTEATVDCSAIEAVGSSTRAVGIRTTGGRADLLIVAGGLAGPARTDAHVRGEIINDNTGTLWLCVADGTPGTWRQLASPTAAGAFHAISPVRVYDSRVPMPIPGPLAGGANRTISVADGRSVDSGAVTTADVVPAGATAVFANVTISDTQGAGFLAVNPGGVNTVSASAINWSATGQIVANGLALALNANRELTVIAGGGSTNFVVDINGFYL